MNLIAFLKPGDVLTAPKALGFVQHMGLVVGTNQVLQNTPERGEHLSTVEGFAQQRPVKVVRTGADPRLVQARTSQALRQRSKYDLLSNNCEHTVTKVLNGVAHSPQVIFWCSLAALGALLVVVLRR